MKLTAGHKGADVRNDCWVEIHPGGKGIQVESSVGRLYGDAIRQTAQTALDRLGLGDVGLTIIDSGAFDFCLLARIEAAAFPISGMHLPVVPREPGVRHGRERLRRTRLYLPGNTPKFFVNAGLHGSDAVVLDLEDAVPPGEKLEARCLVRHALATVDFGESERMVRPNLGLAGSLDVIALESAGADTLLVPKVESLQDLEFFKGTWDLVPLLETAKGMAACNEIATSPEVAALAIGLEDYVTDIGADKRQPGALSWAYGQLVNAARANGLMPLGSVYSQVDDPEGFARSTKELIGMGLEGVGCLHPSQVPIALQAFRPTPEAVEKAKAIWEAYESSEGVVSVNGQMIDAPLAVRAKRVLDRASVGTNSWRGR